MATDIAITIALSTMFRLRRTGVKGTNAMLQRLTINAVNRGMLTALAAAIRLILVRVYTVGDGTACSSELQFLAMPGKILLLADAGSISKPFLQEPCTTSSVLF